MKLPANPVQPYIRHNAHTLGDLKKRDQGTGPFGARLTARPETMKLRSAALTWGISSGRLRNHSQKKAHQTRPRTVRTPKGAVQLPKTPLISQTTSSGARAPPRRVNIQT